MSKSKIIGQLINNEIDLTVALRRLYVLVNDLGNEEIREWVDKEINGYSSTDQLPEYRIFKSCELRYSGINGSYQITAQPLPNAWLSKNTIDAISTHRITAPISEIEVNAKSAELLQIGRTNLAGEVQKNTFDDFFGGVQCIEIHQVVPAAQFGRIITAVMDKVLKALLELDKKFGCLDDLDIDTSKLKKKELAELSANLGVIINTKKIKITGSNVGSGINTTNKTTEVNIETEVNIAKEDKKGCFLCRLFRRKK